MKKVYPCRISASEEERYVQYLPFEEFGGPEENSGNRWEGEIIDFFRARRRLVECSIQKDASGVDLPLLIS